MKKRFFYLILSTIFLSAACSSDESTPSPDTDISGSRIKAFSSCDEIESIVSAVLYNNRDLNEDKSSINDEAPPSFRCEWEQEQLYDPNDMFIMRATNVRTNYDARHITPEELLEIQSANGSQQVTDQRLNHSDYNNVLITKGYGELLRANTYTAFIWVEDEYVNRIIIEDIDWSENILELLDDAAVVDMFVQMLEPAD